MSKIRFTKSQIEKLSKNKYVLRISDKLITYSNEFKIHFIAEYEKGKNTEIEFLKAEVEL